LVDPLADSLTSMSDDRRSNAIYWVRQLAIKIHRYLSIKVTA